MKKRLESGTEISGWKISSSAGRKYVETKAIADASKNISIETLILAMGGKMSEKQYFELCANNNVQPDNSQIKSGSPITTLRQTKVK